MSSLASPTMVCSPSPLSPKIYPRDELLAISRARTKEAHQVKVAITNAWPELLRSLTNLPRAERSASNSPAPSRRQSPSSRSKPRNPSSLSQQSPSSPSAQLLSSEDAEAHSRSRGRARSRSRRSRGGQNGRVPEDGTVGAAPVRTEEDLITILEGIRQKTATGQRSGSSTAASSRDPSLRRTIAPRRNRSIVDQDWRAVMKAGGGAEAALTETALPEVTVQVVE